VSAHDIKILLVAKHSKNKKFESLLKEVFPEEIPTEMIDQIVLELQDGTQAKLDHSDLKDPLPTAPDKTWATMIQSFSNVKKITIVVDVNSVEKQTNKKVKNVLDKHFD
jgi:hypothetical protein